MLLLGGISGRADEPLDRIYTVKSAGKKSATLVSYSERMTMTVSLTKNGIPRGWQLINGTALAAELAKRLDDKREQLKEGEDS